MEPSPSEHAQDCKIHRRETPNGAGENWKFSIFCRLKLKIDSPVEAGQSSGKDGTKVGAVCDVLRDFVAARWVTENQEHGIPGAVADLSIAVNVAGCDLHPKSRIINEFNLTSFFLY